MNVREASALLLAGRVLDQFFSTVGHVRTLRRLAATREIEVVVAGDTTYRGAPSEAEDDLNLRVAIGIPIAVVTANEPPWGPIEPTELRDALKRIGRVGDQWWREVGRELGHGGLFTPRQRRDSLPARLQRPFEGVAFDGPDLAGIGDRLHLVAAGPLASALLANGRLADLPRDEDGDLDPSALEGWVFGRSSSQGPPSVGVHGKEIAGASILDLGTQAVALEHFDLSTYLIARYD